MSNLRIALAQINCIVGDLQGNAVKINDYIAKAKKLDADIVVFPELAITGYPPEDLLLKPKFIRDNLSILKELAGSVKDIIAIVGFIDQKDKLLYNAASLIHQGKVGCIYHKMLLPNYGVFDEKRYFHAGESASLFKAGQVIFGINICEDIWHEAGPIEQQAKSGAKLILNISASPYHAGKIKEREAIICRQARKNKVAIAYTNLVGGQDELVFDGQSMVVDRAGKVIARAAAFKEDLLFADLEIPPAKIAKRACVIGEKIFSSEKKPIAAKITVPLEPVEEIYQALTLGLHDYVRKNGFAKVVMGLSGGVDSSLVASLAVDALGRDNVVGVFMPSRFSSEESRRDAEELAGNLKIKFITVPIEGLYEAYLSGLQPHFAGKEKDITEENLQARIRGNILMALSNKFGWLVLTTGNKSETSTGYCTLYGDMAGGFAVIKDVPKDLVYELCRYRNSLGKVIPENCLTKEPTAELRPNQKDSDTLPPYPVLDPILKAYVEEDKELEKITSLGFEREVVEKVMRLVDRSEYKRRQAPPGIKITYKAFGKDRRMPITNRYQG